MTGSDGKVFVAEEPLSSFEEYAKISIAFEVVAVLDVAEPAENSGPFVLTERRLVVPQWKDYDAANGASPLHWTRRFDTSKWGLLAARVNGQLVGGATVAFDTPGLNLLEGLRDQAILWDIRVAPEARGRGIGAALFRSAEEWARPEGAGG